MQYSHQDIFLANSITVFFSSEYGIFSFTPMGLTLIDLGLQPC